MIDASIFKAYDIRGLYGEQIDAEVAYRLGRAFAVVLAEGEGRSAEELRVAVARDMRLTAPELTARYVDGLRDEGAAVLDVGEVATEVLYHVVGSRDLDGGLMCTASHNPKAWTGAKLVKRGAIPLSGDAGIGDVQRVATAGGRGPAADPRGELREEDVSDDFQRAVMSFIEPERVRPMKVVLDGGNGMAGPMVGPLLDELPVEQVQTYWEPNGDFPGHEPNPLLPENRRFVIERVLEEEAELGVAWDGDADRCFFIAESLLGKDPGATILYDVRASRAVADTVRRDGGTAYVNRVGHAFFKTRMREMGAAFGGEVSGHYYFRDFHCADSGTIPALLIVELLSTKGRRMSELLAPYRERYFISGEINSEVSDQEGKMRELADAHPDGEVSWLDGVSVDYSDWHFNVRPSNTEPLLRLNLESLVSPDHMAERRDEVLGLIRR